MKPNLQVTELRQQVEELIGAHTKLVCQMSKLIKRQTKLELKLASAKKKKKRSV